MACAEYEVRRNARGVILHYPIAPVLDLANADLTPDRRRQLHTRAVRELNALEIIFDVLELTDVGNERVWFALKAIRAALDDRLA